MKVSDNQYCFVCGSKNPLGLNAKLEIDRKAQRAECKLSVPAEFQGWEGIVHGGIISALLDEVCVYAGMTVADSVVTGELKTRFRYPLPVEKVVTVCAQVVKQVRRTVLVKAKLSMEGVVLAHAEAKLVVMRA